MHLYRGSTEQFIGDAVRARLASQLGDRFFDEYRYRPAESEVRAWQNSLRAMTDVLQLADLRDQGIIGELRLPLTSKRLEWLVSGFVRARVPDTDARRLNSAFSPRCNCKGGKEWIREVRFLLAELPDYKGAGRVDARAIHRRPSCSIAIPRDGAAQ